MPPAPDSTTGSMPVPPHQSGPDDPAPIAAPLSLPVTEAAKRKSNVPMIAGGLVLMILAALVGASLFAGATARTQVLTINKALDPGHVLTNSDLGVTEIAGGTGIQVIPASERESLIGRTVTSPLPEGSIVHPGYFDADTALVRTKAVHIGAELAPGEFPSNNLPAGTDVTLYLLDDEGAPVELNAELVEAEPARSGSNILVTFEVEEADAGLVAGAAGRDDLRFGVVQTRTVDVLAEDSADEEDGDQPR